MTINIEQQGPNECALAVMGAFTGRPLSEIREVAARVSARMRTPFYYDRVLRLIATELDPTGSLLDLCGGLGSSLQTGRARHLSNRTRRLPRGRGVIRFRWDGRHDGHLVAWADGLVYDPEHPGHPVTLQEYRRTYGARVDYITRELSA